MANSTTALVPVFSGSLNNEPAQLVDARELHGFLSVKKTFAAWIQGRITQYGFKENQDFVSFFQNGKKPTGGRPNIDYHLTLDMAKELAMVERNDKGREARRYFIECEKRFHQGATATPAALPNNTIALEFYEYLYDGKPLRVTVEGNDIWFSASSLTEALGVSEPAFAYRRLEPRFVRDDMPHKNRRARMIKLEGMEQVFLYAHDQRVTPFRKFLSELLTRPELLEKPGQDPVALAAEALGKQRFIMQFDLNHQMKLTPIQPDTLLINPNDAASINQLIIERIPAQLLPALMEAGLQRLTKLTGQYLTQG
ncbi:hypothetical protein C4K68_07785 [Pokkaliibacter plantistimulans]|uniref:AntA/AntB antirepressor domain-containing protein n=1 Tax=Proteobacteria bacterium 228 TaxID=2083153 RepID=A0A2S5KT60_9PROT|nr:antA/AntB antirepressor family protein [Pokkaliibacter plantistimulans]PPC77938.1 hypothetical protein C4K68_07785 [Pokkaliibacter plantistimulans]